MRVPCPPTTAPTPSSHLDLVAVADAVQGAAITGDLVAVHRDLCRLRQDLVDHVRGEEATHAHLPTTTQTVVRTGQRGLLSLLDDLLSSAAGEDGACPCVLRVAELHRALTRQAHLENNVVAGRTPL